MTIDYDDPNWLTTQLPGADYCAGGLIYFQNNHKTPRREALAKMVKKVLPSPHVFSWSIEFFNHHMPMEKDPEKICETAQRASFPYAQDVE